MSTNNNVNDDLKSDQSASTKICPDKTRCMNNSNCTKSTTDAQYTCTCPMNFTGNYCEVKVTSYCTIHGELSRTAFCTHGSTCKELVPWNSTKVPTCACSSKVYTGIHCETIAPSTQSSNTMNLGKAVGIFIASILLFAFLAGSIFLCMRKRKRRNMMNSSSKGGSITIDHARHYPLELHQQNEAVDFHDDEDDEDLYLDENKSKISQSSSRKSNASLSMGNKEFNNEEGKKNNGMRKDSHDNSDSLNETKKMEEIDIL